MWVNKGVIDDWQCVTKDGKSVFQRAVDITGLPGELTLQQAIIETVEAFTVEMPVYVEDASRYLLFQWDEAAQQLLLTLTDDGKSKDSALLMQLKVNGLTIDAEVLEDIKYWIRDTLTTSAIFMQFSLIAIFTESTRDRADLI